MSGLIAFVRAAGGFLEVSGAGVDISQFLPKSPADEPLGRRGSARWFAGAAMLAGMDVKDLQRAIGGVVLESAYLERVLRAAFSALIGSEYASVIDSRLMASALIEDCRHVAEVHTGIGQPERDALITSLHQCESVNRARNRVIHDDWASRPGNITITLQNGCTSHEVTFTAKTVSELDELADRIGCAADQLCAAVVAALGPASLRIQDQLREERRSDIAPDRSD